MKQLYLKQYIIYTKNNLKNTVIGYHLRVGIGAYKLLLFKYTNNLATDF